MARTKQARSGAPDTRERKALLTGEIGRIETRVNLVAEREVGAGAADMLGHEYAAQSRSHVTDQLALDRQASVALGSRDRFGRLSDLADVVGPILAGDFHVPGVKSEVELETAYLVGVTDARPDDVVRLQIEWEKKF